MSSNDDRLGGDESEKNKLLKEMQKRNIIDGVVSDVPNDEIDRKKLKDDGDGNEDDESDSCFNLTKRNLIGSSLSTNRTNNSNENTDSASHKIQSKYERQEEPQVMPTKTITTATTPQIKRANSINEPNKLVKVKPIGGLMRTNNVNATTTSATTATATNASTSIKIEPIYSIGLNSSSPNKTRIDAIADNLKINLLQQKQNKKQKDETSKLPNVKPLLNLDSISTNKIDASSPPPPLPPLPTPSMPMPKVSLVSVNRSPKTTKSKEVLQNEKEIKNVEVAAEAAATDVVVVASKPSPEPEPSSLTCQINKIPNKSTNENSIEKSNYDFESLKQMAHKLIISNCKKITSECLAKGSKPFKDLSQSTLNELKKEDQIEMDDDELTDLNWLTKFDLCKSVGVDSLSLSPPSSPPPPLPPRPPAPELVASSRQLLLRPTSIPRQILLAATSLKRQSSNRDDLIRLNEDESDSSFSYKKPLKLIIDKPTTATTTVGCLKMPDISDIIKPWLPTSTASTSSSDEKCSTTTTATTQKYTNNSCQQTSQRPPYSFSCLTFLAIESSERKRLSVKEIYSWITLHFPYYRSVPSGSWKNSIRHNLSYNHCFCKVDKNLLAMRDFSGKGSLWCINPEYRPLLIEALLKTPTHEQHQQALAKIPFLQDVTESPKTNTINISSSVYNNNNNGHGNGNSHSKSYKNRSTPNLSTGSAVTIVNPRLTNKIGLYSSSSSINGQSPTAPKITNVTSKISKLSGGASGMTLANKSNSFSKSSSSTLSLNQPPTTPVTPSNSQQSINQSFMSPSIFSDVCPEMTAVKALLSMKSRASSMPNTSNQITRSQDPTPKSANIMSPKPAISTQNSSAQNNASPQISALATTTGSAPPTAAPAPTPVVSKQGRRKQLFKPPTKKINVRYISFEDDDENDEEMSGLNHVDDEEISNFGDDLFQKSDDELSNANSSISLKKQQQQHNHNQHQQQQQQLNNNTKSQMNSNRNKQKKLLVKLPYFKNKSTAASSGISKTKEEPIESKQVANEREEDEEDEYEDRRLEIDENFHESDEDNVTKLTNNKIEQDSGRKKLRGGGGSSGKHSIQSNDMIDDPAPPLNKYQKLNVDINSDEFSSQYDDESSQFDSTLEFNSNETNSSDSFKINAEIVATTTTTTATAVDLSKPKIKTNSNKLMNHPTTSKSFNNALLELSRAAILIEEQKEELIMNDEVGGALNASNDQLEKQQQKEIKPPPPLPPQTSQHKKNKATNLIETSKSSNQTSRSTRSMTQAAVGHKSSKRQTTNISNSHANPITGVTSQNKTITRSFTNKIKSKQ